MKKPRDKISSLLAEGKIIRIKKGLYVFGEAKRRTSLSNEVIANLIYGPSCISLEYALARYGLIADRPTVITSVAIGDNKFFDTPIGMFEYRAIAAEKFKIGIEYRNLGQEGGYFIASREKALVDLVDKTIGIRTVEQLHYYLFEEMRIDETMYRQLDFFRLQALAQVYKKKKVKMMSEL